MPASTSAATDRTTCHRVNIAESLTATASAMPTQIAIAEALPRGTGSSAYRTVTFAELDEDSSRIAAGLARLGIGPRKRIVLMVRPGVDFITLTFALFKSGATTVLIDPGMGRGKMLECLSSVRPDGFVAIPLAHAVRTLVRRRFPSARLNVTVGRRWFWSGATLSQLRSQPTGNFRPADTTADDPAAIIFTSGSTGLPKGVLYRHGNFAAQVDQLRAHYQIQPGGVDLAAFPLFALFNAAHGNTTVVPCMDASRPASVDPRRIVGAIRDWQVTQSFASPAVWNVVGKYCERHAVKLDSLRRVFSAGAPVPPHVLRRMTAAMADAAEMYTPYGATEALPVASISAREVLGETASLSAEGRGTCVGGQFAGITWRVIQITDEPIATIDEAESAPPGEIGELIVKGTVVTVEYVTRVEANLASKIRDGGDFWHRMGDVGYLDEKQRFWFCGRKSQRVQTPVGTMFTVPCEAILNEHPAIYRTALVGVGRAPNQVPAMVCEPWPERFPRNASERAELLRQLAELAAASPLTTGIPAANIFLRRSLPVDIRHNAKIFRERLSAWAAPRVATRRQLSDNFP